VSRNKDRFLAVVAMIGQTFRYGSVLRLGSFTELEEESLSCVIGNIEAFYV
jgi:hypothetical protein